MHTLRNASRETHKLRIAGPPIRRDALFLKPFLHDYPPRLIEAHIPLLHNPKHLFLTRIVEPRPIVAADNVIRDVEVCGVQPGFDVTSKGGRQWGVPVEVEGAEIEIRPREA